jgi:hypothetical protein
MYFIINRTKNESYTHNGFFPSEFIEGLLKQGDDVIIISTYSNTIKIPELKVIDGENELDIKEYNIPMAFWKFIS